MRPDGCEDIHEYFIVCVLSTGKYTMHFIQINKILYYKFTNTIDFTSLNTFYLILISIIITINLKEDKITQ